MKSDFIVSLDFELIWGMHEGDIINNSYNENLKGGRNAIPQLLALFEQYGIHATWAVVGLMFAENVEEAKKYFPEQKLQPSYHRMKLSMYPLIDSINTKEADSSLYFAPEVIAKIAQTKGQEIASHTFAHYYCREEGQTTTQFEADLKAAKAIASDKGYELTSIVFPRNQCKKEYIRVLKGHGFTAYREDSSDWLHRRIRFLPLLRILRLLDAYFPITGYGGYLPTTEDGVTAMIGSRMFRPYMKPLAFLEAMKIRRIKKQMLHAAKKGLTYHLWWHPHNIGVKTEHHLKSLEEIFKYYEYLRDTYGMQSKNMAEVAQSSCSQ